MKAFTCSHLWSVSNLLSSSPRPRSSQTQMVALLSPTPPDASGLHAPLSVGGLHVSLCWPVSRAGGAAPSLCPGGNSRGSERGEASASPPRLQSSEDQME